MDLLRWWHGLWGWTRYDFPHATLWLRGGTLADMPNFVMFLEEYRGSTMLFCNVDLRD